MELDHDILEDIRGRALHGRDNRNAIFEWILDNYPEQLGITKEQYGVDDLDDVSKAALWSAINAAFATLAEEAKGWPAVTDHDRLLNAFAALERQGIVTQESAGLTIEEGSAVVANLAVARDALGAGESRGCCFFTDQDVMHAIESDGLLLAYGSYEKDPPPVVVPPPAKCPLCNGRGWVAPSDPSQFPAQCECRAAPPPPEPAPPPSMTQKVGIAVADACREAGLVVDWNGAENTRIKLAKFHWQRRPVVTQESDVRDFFDSWELELRAGYTRTSRMLSALEEHAADWFAGFSDFGPELQERLRAHTARFLEEEEQREASWTDATMNDRITGAFEELDEAGILARECLGLTIHDGWGYAGTEARSGPRGVAFFHHEDVIDGVDGRGLLVAFGAISVEGPEADAATRTVGSEILSALQRSGIPCSWSESITDRIRIEPFEWRRRRWSEAAAYERLPLAAAVSKRPSLLSRIFGGGKAANGKPPIEEAPISAREHAIAVRAVRDESGFDLRRSRRLRAVWKTLGLAGDAHVGHVGVPHVFTPAGGFTTLAPRLATSNLGGEERHALFGRGARAKSPD